MMSRKSLDGFMEELKNVTYGTYPRKFCFFLGAGASTTSGIPSGQDLVRQWDAYMKKDNPKGHLRWRAELGITDENMVSFYSEYYDRRFRDFPTDGYAEIERITAAGRPSAGYLLLAQLLTNSPHNVVITTNFDHLTEDAVTKFTGRLPLVIGHENLAGYVTGHPSRPTVIKIHRDLLLEPKSATTALQTMDKQWESALEKIFSNYHPVFIGYAGNDKSVMDYLLANAGRFKTDWKKPYWMFYGQEVKSPTVRQFLEESDGIRMFGCGFDEVMVRMGQALGCRLPDLGEIQEQEMEAFGEIRQNYTKIITNPYLPILEEIANLVDYEHSNDAIEKCRLITSLVPEFAKGHYWYARCLEGIKKYDVAEREYREAIRLNPTDTYSFWGLGNLLFELKRFGEAIMMYHHPVRFDPQNAINHEALADILVDAGYYEEAITVYRNAINLNPQKSSLYAHIGELLKRMGRHEEATALRAKADALRKPK